MLLYPNAYEDDSMRELREECNKIETETIKLLRQAEQQKREALVRYEDALIGKRPCYPTPEQAEGLKLAVQWVLGDVIHGSLPPNVKCNIDKRLINVFARAPFLRRHNKLAWTLEASEVESFKKIIADQGGVVVEDWMHEDGHGFVLE